MEKGRLEDSNSKFAVTACQRGDMAVVMRGLEQRVGWTKPV
jgi:hypothetical protein